VNDLITADADSEAINIVDGNIQPDQEQSKSKYDSQSRKYLLTANDPIPKGLTHDRIIEILMGFKGILYFCMADEQGSCYHTHIYAVFRSPVRFSTIQKRFDSKVRIDTVYADSATCRAYVFKEGEKWDGTEKQATRIENSTYEWGELPQEIQGARNDLTFLYEMVKAGYSNFEIIENNPEFILRITDIERARKTVLEEENRQIFRQLEVTYISGETATGKTRYVMEKYGYENCYRITNYKHPFDAYKNQDVIIFDEFSSSLKIQDVLNYTDGYPLSLPCRYSDKMAVYTKVYIISNLCLKGQYRGVQINEPSVWRALLRRIHKVIRFMTDGTRRECDTKDYIKGADNWTALPADTLTPFDSATSSIIKPLVVEQLPLLKIAQV
jgi:hypothetical protein